MVQFAYLAHASRLRPALADDKQQVAEEALRNLLHTVLQQSNLLIDFAKQGNRHGAKFPGIMRNGIEEATCGKPEHAAWGMQLQRLKAKDRVEHNAQASRKILFLQQLQQTGLESGALLLEQLREHFLRWLHYGVFRRRQRG